MPVTWNSPIGLAERVVRARLPVCVGRQPSRRAARQARSLRRFAVPSVLAAALTVGAGAGAADARDTLGAGDTGPSGDDTVIVTGARNGKPIHFAIDVPRMYRTGDLSPNLELQNGDTI